MTGSSVAVPPTLPSPKWVVTLTWLLLVASVVPWRRAVLYSGGLDPVVLLKALSGSVALLLAAQIASRGTRYPVGVRSVLFAVTYAVITLIGAMAGTSPLPSIIEAVRFLMISATLILLFSARPAEEAITEILGWLGVFGVVSAVTGIGATGGISGSADGRLQGGIPPLTPNSLAMLFAVLLLLLIWRSTHGQQRRWHLPVILAAMAVIWTTGSRTSLAAVAVAALYLLAHHRHVTRVAIGIAFALLPVLVFVVAGTSVSKSVFDRGGSASVTTLSSRTIAWDAALHQDLSGWQSLFGQGLAVKQVPVVGQYWATQVIDSSWVSALVQGGYLGVALAAVWTIGVVVSIARTRGVYRTLWIALAIFLLPRSILESGLFGSAADFILFMSLSLVSERVRREVARGERERAAEPPAPPGPPSRPAEALPSGMAP